MICSLTSGMCVSRPALSTIHSWQKSANSPSPVLPLKVFWIKYMKYGQRSAGFSVLRTALAYLPSAAHGRTLRIPIPMVRVTVSFPFQEVWLMQTSSLTVCLSSVPTGICSLNGITARILRMRILLIFSILCSRLVLLVLLVPQTTIQAGGRLMSVA